MIEQFPPKAKGLTSEARVIHRGAHRNPKPKTLERTRLNISLGKSMW